MTSHEAALLRDIVRSGQAEVPRLDPHKLARSYVALCAAPAYRGGEEGTLSMADGCRAGSGTASRDSRILEPWGALPFGFPQPTG